MKIEGPNLTNLHAYQNKVNKQTDYKQGTAPKDQLNISSEAKHLQESKQINKERTAYVQEIKNAVQSGEYEVDFKKTAEKMIDFWSKQ